MRSLYPGLAALILLYGCAEKENPAPSPQKPEEPEVDNRYSLPEGESTCKTWNDFEKKTKDNVLDDFSYAGYDHGRSCPPEVESLGYRVFNVCDYGAVPNDGKSDREALLKCLETAFGASPKNGKLEIVFKAPADARVVIYFPEGEFILHTEEDNVKQSDGYFDTKIIRIDGGGFVLKGAGRDKTRIVIKDPLLPQNHGTYTQQGVGMYSSAWLMNLGQQDALDVAADALFTSGMKVSENAEKGSHLLTLVSAGGLEAGDWCCLRAIVKDAAYIKKATCSLPLGTEWAINQTGVSLREYHQIESVDGNTVRLVEPLLAEVDATKDFYVVRFSPNRGIGVEDMTFVGQNENNFVHHGSWIPDGAYKTVEYNDCVDSWMRRCDFESVSEIVLFSYCANCSVYDLNLSGWRGHNNARMARSSWNFFGKIRDTSNGIVHKVGYVAPNRPGHTVDGVGSYHGPGVAYESSGNVFWRCVWGSDAGFESHGRQSRNNLWDACTGGFLSHRQGGGTDDMPNHMGGLVFWNFKSINDWPDFSWWSKNTAMYVVKPTVVGIHGGNVTFAYGTTTVDESNGAPVDVGSLYEAQLRLRLGAVPAWLNSIK